MVSDFVFGTFSIFLFNFHFLLIFSFQLASSRVHDEISSSSNPQLSEPDEFLCPITGVIMKDPVSDNQGISYEREAIETWLKRGNTTSPSTQQHLQLSDLRPNIALRKLIEDWQNQKQ